MSIQLTMKCDYCSDSTPIEADCTVRYAEKLQRPYGQYEHVCHSCLNQLQDDQFEEEQLKIELSYQELAA